MLRGAHFGALWTPKSSSSRLSTPSLFKNVVLHEIHKFAMNFDDSGEERTSGSTILHGLWSHVIESRKHNNIMNIAFVAEIGNNILYCNILYC